MIKPYFWHLYSNLLKERILAPRHIGHLDPERGAQQEMRICVGEENRLRLYIAVDEHDGVIAEAKFQAFGTSALIGAGDLICSLILRKNHLQAGRITADLIDQQGRDFRHENAFPPETYYALNYALGALHEALRTCSDIEVQESLDSSTFFEQELSKQTGSQGSYPPFGSLASDEERLSLIRKVVAEQIQPYIALDEGSVNVLELRNRREVIIGYAGACVGCPSATGATLHAIEQMLKSQVDPDLQVIPQL